MRASPRLAALLLLAAALALLLPDAGRAQELTPAPVPGNDTPPPNDVASIGASDIRPEMVPDFVPGGGDGFLPGSQSGDVDVERSVPAAGLDLSIPLDE